MADVGGIGGPFIDDIIKNHLGPVISDLVAKVGTFVQTFATNNLHLPPDLSAELVKILTEGLTALVTALLSHYLP